MRIPFGTIPKEFVSRALTYEFKDPLTAVFPKVSNMGAVIVTKGGEYYGIVDVRAATGNGSLRMDKNYPVGRVARKLPPLTKDTDMKKAISLFYTMASKALPFAEDGKIIGVVHRNAILKAMLSMHTVSGMKVNEIMSTPLMAVDQETNVERARAAMRDYRVKRLAVLDHGRLFGMLTTRNLMEYGMVMRHKLPELPVTRKHIKVSDVCERNIRTIDYGRDVEDAIRSFVENGISSLPVIRNGRPVGIITVRDVFETILKNSNAEKRNIMVSGMTDPDLREMEEDVIAELEAFADKVDRLRNFKVDYIAFNVKRIKSREYELRARMGLSRGGAMSISTSGYSLEATLKDLLSKMLKEVRGSHDVILTERKV